MFRVVLPPKAGIPGFDGQNIIRGRQSSDAVHNGLSIVTRSFTSTQQGDFLSTSGHLCVGQDQDIPNEYHQHPYENESLSNPVAAMYQQLENVIQGGMERGTRTRTSNDAKLIEVVKGIQNDLWKFCALGSGYASAYMDPEQVITSGMNTMHFFQKYSKKNYVTVFKSSEPESYEQGNTVNTNTRRNHYNDDDLDLDTMNQNGARERAKYHEEARSESGKTKRVQWINSSVMILGQTESGRRVAKAMVGSLLYKANELFEVSSSATTTSTHIHNNASTIMNNYNHGMWSGIELLRLVRQELDTYTTDEKSHHEEWVLGKLKCSGLHAVPHHLHAYQYGDIAGYCARDARVPCCQVLDGVTTSYAQTKGDENVRKVELLLRHAVEAQYVHKYHTEETALHSDNVSKGSSTSYVVEPESFKISPGNPYISSIVEVPPVSDSTAAPNARRMFDIMAENDCLPSLDCHRCLIRQKTQDFKSQCTICELDCGCYCKMLCRIQPRTKKIVKECHVHIPSIKANKNSKRLIPKKIHQTYFEEVTRDKYPNFSRLVMSWKLSGSDWEYNFYDNAASEEFLSRHFPPEVREAYDALIPGTFNHV